MRARVASSALLLAALATAAAGPAGRLTAGPEAARASAWTLARGEYGSEVETSMYSTATSYDASGNRIAFPSGAKLQQLGFAWRNQIGWRKKLNLLFGLTGANVIGFDGPPLTVPAQTGFANIALGLHYSLHNGRDAAAIEAGWTAPAGYDRELTRALGDGRQELAGQLALGWGVSKSAFVEFDGGYAYRFHKLGSSDDAAKLDPRMTTTTFWTANADAGWWFKPSVLIGGRFKGRYMATTTGQGDASNVHEVGPMVLTGNAQIDEKTSLIGPLIRFRLDDRADVTGGSYSTFGGRNTFHFDQFYIALTFKQSKLKRNQGFLGSSSP
jgi:hypothetical protein